MNNLFDLEWAKKVCSFGLLIELEYFFGPYGDARNMKDEEIVAFLDIKLHKPKEIPQTQLALGI